MAVVYLHRRKDTNEVFYVGVGKNKRRAFVRAKRNPHWKAIVNKYDYNVEIAFKGLSYDEALTIEQELIALIGRSDKGEGPLTNMTDGGEGTLGLEAWNKGKPLSDEHRKNVSLATTEALKRPEVIAKLKKPKGPHTEEWKENMSKKMKEIKNKPPQNQAEREWTEKSRNKVRNNQRGEGNSNGVLTVEQVKYIKRNHKAYDPEFGTTALARKFGCGPSTICCIIKGRNWAWVEV